LVPVSAWCVSWSAWATLTFITILVFSCDENGVPYMYHKKRGHFPCIDHEMELKEGPYNTSPCLRFFASSSSTWWLWDSELDVL
jgi:hypothetical protein